MVDYEEFYLLTDAEFELFRASDAAAAAFAVRCGKREMDERLIIAAGADRGE